MPKRRHDSVADLIPDRPTIANLRAASKDCQACDLWQRGTQTVFGEGARNADLTRRDAAKPTRFIDDLRRVAKRRRTTEDQR